MMPTPCLQIYPQLRVTLTFALLTPKVDRFTPLLRRENVPICIQIGSFFQNIVFTSKLTGVTNGRTDGRTNGQCASHSAKA